MKDFTIAERKAFVKQELQKSRGVSKRPLGGQHCGTEFIPTIIKSEILGIEISVNTYRQNIKNLEYGLMIFDLIIDDLVK